MFSQGPIRSHWPEPN